MATLKAITVCCDEKSCSDNPNSTLSQRTLNDDLLNRMMSMPSCIGYQSILSAQSLIDETIHELAFETMRDCCRFPDLLSIDHSKSKLDIFGNAPWIPKNETDLSGNFPCDACQRPVPITKYASHLEKCVGKYTRTSSRVHQQQLSSSTQTSRPSSAQATCRPSLQQRSIIHAHQHQGTQTADGELTTANGTVVASNTAKRRRRSADSKVAMAPIPPPVSIPLSLEDDLASQLISDPNLLSELESLLALEFSGSASASCSDPLTSSALINTTDMVAFSSAPSPYPLTRSRSQTNTPNTASRSHSAEAHNTAAKPTSAASVLGRLETLLGRGNVDDAFEVSRSSGGELAVEVDDPRLKNLVGQALLVEPFRAVADYHQRSKGSQCSS